MMMPFSDTAVMSYSRRSEMLPSCRSHASISQSVASCECAASGQAHYFTYVQGSAEVVPKAAPPVCRGSVAAQ